MRRRRAAFTLIEVMGAVLVLGLLFTWLASVAMIGLRSEGTDHRRADAELVADLELSTIETSITPAACRRTAAASATRSRSAC
jgi:hypothetical protein